MYGELYWDINLFVLPLKAAFTTPVLLFGGQQYVANDTMLEAFIVARVEMTVIGVVLYMIVEGKKQIVISNGNALDHTVRPAHTIGKDWHTSLLFCFYL